MVLKVRYNDIICIEIASVHVGDRWVKVNQSRKNGGYGVSEPLFWFSEGCYC